MSKWWKRKIKRDVKEAMNKKKTKILLHMTCLSCFQDYMHESFYSHCPHCGSFSTTYDTSRDSPFVEGNNNAHYHISRLHDPSGFIGNWVDVGGDSEAQISKDVTALVGNPSNTIEILRARTH